LLPKTPKPRSIYNLMSSSVCFKVLLLSLPLSQQSTENVGNFNNCIGCIKAGHDYCMLAPGLKPGYCCQAMASATDYCDADNLYTYCTQPYA